MRIVRFSSSPQNIPLFILLSVYFEWFIVLNQFQNEMWAWHDDDNDDHNRNIFIIKKKKQRKKNYLSFVHFLPYFLIYFLIRISLVFNMITIIIFVCFIFIFDEDFSCILTFDKRSFNYFWKSLWIRNRKKYRLINQKEQKQLDSMKL